MDTVYIEASIVSFAAHTMPQKAAADALHVAAGGLAGVTYLPTRNCTHIANAHELPGIDKLLRDEGHDQFLICPLCEFSGGNSDD